MDYSWMDEAEEDKKKKEKAVTAATSSTDYSWMDDDKPATKVGSIAAPVKKESLGQTLEKTFGKTEDYMKGLSDIPKGVASPLLEGAATLPEIIYNVNKSFYSGEGLAEGWNKGPENTQAVLDWLHGKGISLRPDTPAGKKATEYVHALMNAPFAASDAWIDNINQALKEVSGKELPEDVVKELKAGSQIAGMVGMAGMGARRGRAEPEMVNDGLTPSQRMLMEDARKEAETVQQQRQPTPEPVQPNAYTERARITQEELVGPPDEPIRDKVELQRALDEAIREQYVTTQKAPEAPVERTVTPSDLAQRADVGDFQRSSPKDWRTLVEEKLAEQVPAEIKADMSNFKRGEPPVRFPADVVNRARENTERTIAGEADIAKMHTTDLGLGELKKLLKGRVDERESLKKDLERFSGKTDPVSVKRLDRLQKSLDSVEQKIADTQTRIQKAELQPFHTSLGESINRRVEASLEKVKNYKDWKFNEGDRVRSRKTGKVYEITRKYWDSKKDVPTYYYKSLDGEEGMMYAETTSSKYLGELPGAHETMEKLTGPQRSGDTIDMNSFGSWFAKDKDKDYRRVPLPAVSEKKLVKETGPVGRLTSKSLTAEARMQRNIEDMKMDPNKTPEQLKTEIFDDKGTPIYEDMSEFQTAITSQVASGGYLKGMHPIVRDVVAKVYDAVNRADHVWNDILWGESPIDFSKVLRIPKRVRTAEGALTEFSHAPLDIQTKIVDVAFDVDRETTRLSKEGKEVREVGDAELAQRGLNEREIAIYRKLRGGLDKAFDLLKEAGMDIDRIPNYIMHMWDGPWRAWVHDAEGKPVAVFGLQRKWGGAKEAEKLIGEGFTENGYTVRVEPTNRRAGILDTVDLEALFHVMRGDARTEVVDAVSKGLKARGFSAHELHRKGQEGYKGTYGSPKERVQGFETGYQTLIRSAVRKAEQLKLQQKVGELQKQKDIAEAYPNALKAGAAYFDHAFGGAYKWADTVNTVANRVANWAGFSLEGVRGGVGALNRFFIASKVMVLNPRMYVAQALQPEAYVLPRMAKHSASFNEASAARAYVESWRDFVLMPEEVKSMLREVEKRGALDTSQLHEVELGLKESFGVKNRMKGPVDVVAEAAKELSGINTFARMEIQSRVRAAIMLHNTLKHKFKDKELYDIVANETNDAMMDYRQHARAQVYSGLGEMGTVFSPLTTFKHGALSQFVDYVRTAKRDKRFTPLLNFSAVQIAMAGLSGMILLKEADAFIALANVIRAQMGYEPIDNATELIMKRIDSDGVKFGLLSGITQQNFSATLGFPGFAEYGGSLVASPALSMASDMAGAGVDALTDVIKGGTVTDKNVLAMGRSVLPTAMQAGLEEYYMDKEGTDVVPDKNMQGVYHRSEEEQNMRYLNLMSLDETKARNAQFSNKKQDFFYQEAKAQILAELVNGMENNKKIPDRVWEQIGALGITQKDVKRAMNRKLKGEYFTYEEREGMKQPTPNMARRLMNYQEQVGE